VSKSPWGGIAGGIKRVNWRAAQNGVGEKTNGGRRGDTRDIVLKREESRLRSHDHGVGTVEKVKARRGRAEIARY